MHTYDADDPRMSNTGVVPDDDAVAFSADMAELVIEGFDNSGFHLRIGDVYYCAKNFDDLIAVCIDSFGGGNNDYYR